MTATAPRLHNGELVDLHVTGLAFGGKGVARIDDFVVFVAGAVPGDTVRARVTKYKRRYAEARTEALLTPSPDRRPPRCPSFGVCGGCVWQDLDYGVQLRYKAAQVRESLEHLGGLRDVEMVPIVGMADPWRYRNRADFSIGMDEGEAVIGFRPPGRWDAVLPISECHLLGPAIERVRAIAEDWLRESGLPGWEPRTGVGFARHLLVRSAQAGGEVLVSLVTAPEVRTAGGVAGPVVTSDRVPDLAGLVQRLRSLPQVVGVTHAINPGRAEVSSGLGGATLWGRPFLIERVAGVALKVSVDAFFQTNTLMAHELYRIIDQEAGAAAGPVIWDLYSGVGSIGLSLAGRAKAVLCIEGVPAAVTDAQENARLNGIENAHFLEGDVARVLGEVADGRRTLPGEVGYPDVIIVDPPRAGLAKKAVSRIGEVGAHRIVYVSCNPATMAPNAAQLQQYGYRVAHVTPVDMFPHTPHVECVALLTADRS